LKIKKEYQRRFVNLINKIWKSSNNVLDNPYTPTIYVKIISSQKRNLFVLINIRGKTFTKNDENFSFEIVDHNMEMIKRKLEEHEKKDFRINVAILVIWLLHSKKT
jgi:hypothetical protein